MSSGEKRTQEKFLRRRQSSRGRSFQVEGPKLRKRGHMGKRDEEMTLLR